ncbi:hypothetical protein EBQ24_02805 [Allofranklinella schreckenbergeri]|uniref:Uncharacterized protein n=1 Tax=Allofranklinella schreckenbergeri TaxID=1076744 RepID=A0A3M6R8S8_9BURK|nr:hypothetical protein EBQ24_02805 [Allofranklinella schreckenbergeri]
MLEGEHGQKRGARAAEAMFKKAGARAQTKRGILERVMHFALSRGGGKCITRSQADHNALACGKAHSK